MRTHAKAIQAINQHGALLVFPLENRPEPASIWSALHPRAKMRWEWDDDGDNRVAELWHLRTELSTSRKVVYAKWFRGRATFFSRPLFAALVRRLALDSGAYLPAHLPTDARSALEALESDSPLSTKQLRLATGLTGKLNESAYTRALQMLWRRLLIVGFGEFDDGAFPSLAIGATSVIFEDLWQEARALSSDQAEALIRATLPASSLFLKHYERSL